jgi:hypothetical protein
VRALNARATATTLIITSTLIEGFNDSIFPPPGWQANIIMGTYNWGRYISGSNPSCQPYEGSGMAGVRLYMAPVMNAARLITPPIILGSTTTSCSLKFYMMHDPGYATAPDSIKIETSTNGTTFNQVTAFNRYSSTQGWVEHTVYFGNLSGTIYIGFLAYWGSGNNMNIDYVRLMPLGIAEGKINNIPLITMLNPPRPNPITNGITHLSFTVAEQSQVSLKIFDASGRLVKTLVDEFKSSGLYSVNWNCRDDYGRKVAEGVYFYTLETPKQKFCRKMVLIQN